MSWMRSATPLLSLLLGLGLVGTGCQVNLDDDDDDDDTADDDTADDDTADDDTADDDTADDDTADDDTVFGAYQLGTAELGAAWDMWDGVEYYWETIGSNYTCDVGYITTGDRTDACTDCEFSFDVTYTVDYDNSTLDCYYSFAPGDGETVSLGYYYYTGYYGSVGLMLYYAAGYYGYGWYYWGFANVSGETLDYYYPYGYPTGP
ncbi:hypothetical protein L6R50_14050 [Myxococcota bacterium]|nr:hypothetical protein [Myxococcota bacterium]